MYLGVAPWVAPRAPPAPASGSTEALNFCYITILGK